MSDTGELLAASIDRLLGNEQPEQGVAELLCFLDKYLTLPLSHDLRASAEKVASLTSRASGADSDGGVFQTALTALREAVGAQLEQDEAASQLAGDPEMVQEFLVESRTHLAVVESGLLRLEAEPGDSEALNSVFRSFHTIKGLAGFLGAAAIHELAHETENVLDLARSGKLIPTPEVIDLILRAGDELSRCLDLAGAGDFRDMPRCNPELLNAMAAIAVESPEVGQTSLITSVPSRPETASAVARQTSEGRVVRIETAKLEYLIDMVGELVIAESVVRHDPAIAASPDPLLSRNLMQLGRVIQEVQKTSMSMRMVAVGTLFRKMTRLVRDVARKSGKSVEMITVGDDVELDRSIVEELADPMVHMIRNAVDHGLETATERRAAGKNEKGIIRLKAAHDAGEIVIEISDDGRGMSPEKILAKARRQGLVGPDTHLDEDAILKLIFEPGFSTAEKVTDMSGRGVGMDVVRKQIQKLRGRIAIRSVVGEGSAFIIRLPLTLAIIDGLVVGCESQRFILPMFAIREMFAPQPGMIVTLENRAEAANFRGKLYPIVRLSGLLSGPVEMAQLGDLPAKGILVVVESRDQLFCIAVDQLIGKQEVVIKSLGPTFRDVPAISGGAILGDGRVGLIVDVNSLRTGRAD